VGVEERTERFTTPVNPLKGLTVTVEVPGAFALTVTDVGLAVSAKSLTLNVLVVLCDSEPLVPVTVTCTKPPAGKLQDRVEDPEPVRLMGDKLHEVLSATRFTTLGKPFRLVTVTVEIPTEPAGTVRDVGLAEMLKSHTISENVIV